MKVCKINEMEDRYAKYKSHEYSDEFRMYLDELKEQGRKGKNAIFSREPYMEEYMNKVVDCLMNNLSASERTSIYNEYNYASNECIFENNTRETEKEIEKSEIGVFELLQNNGGWNYFDNYVMIGNDEVYSFNDNIHVMNDREFVEYFLYGNTERRNGLEETFSRLRYRSEDTPEENRTCLITNYYDEETYDAIFAAYEKWCDANDYDIVNQ